MLKRDLATISSRVDESGAVLAQGALAPPVGVAHDAASASSTLRRWATSCVAFVTRRKPPPSSGAPVPPTVSNAELAAEWECTELLAVADCINGDAYVRERVQPGVVQSLRAARRLLLAVLLARSVALAAAAAGAALAVVGQAQWAAVTVALATAANRVLQTTRIEARRRALMHAASALNAAKVRWEALPSEERARQLEIDRLVLKVEQALEATLPPASSVLAAPRKSEPDGRSGGERLLRA